MGRRLRARDYACRFGYATTVATPPRHSRQRRSGDIPARWPHERRHPRREGIRRYIRPVQEDGYFDERVAARYDEAAAELFDPGVVDPAVAFLVELAGSGRALELGIGTGRIALPLAQRGVPVHGIELSKAMAVRLREKPGGEDIGVTIGDFATTTVSSSRRRRIGCRRAARPRVRRTRRGR